jgi:hypothetical protein
MDNFIGIAILIRKYSISQGDSLTEYIMLKYSPTNKKRSTKKEIEKCLS